MASPLERSKEELENQGYDVWKVERPASMWQPTLDLFNCIDLLGIHDELPNIGIQCCGEDIAPHITKIMEGYTKQKIKKGELITEIIPPNPYLKKWLKRNQFFIWGWRLRANKGKKASYQLREVEFIIENGVVVHRENPHVKESVPDSSPGSSDRAVLDIAAPVADPLLRAFQEDRIVE